MIGKFFNRVRSVFYDGLKIYFDGEPRDVMELISFDRNDHTQKIALVLNDPAEWGVIFKTGYVFSMDDFHPRLDTVDWRNYAGVLKCYRNIDGKTDGRHTELKHTHEIIRKLRKELETMRVLVHQQNKEFALGTLSENRKKEAFHNAKTFADMKKLFSEVEKPEKESMSKYFNQ